MNDQINELLRTAHRLTQEIGREPTSEELAGALEIPMRALKCAFGLKIALNRARSVDKSRIM
jgi:DNA-directed RNA polymerase sigma subunit (sigma70/sigma32)